MAEDISWDAPKSSQEDISWDAKPGRLAPEAADHGLSERQKLSPLGKALSPITSYPETYQRMNQDARDTMSSGVDQIKAQSLKTLTDPKEHGISDALTGVGKTALGAVEYVASPISAAYRSIAGQPVEDVTGIPREVTEFTAQLATPGMGLVKSPMKEPPKIVPVKPEANGPLGVTLSEGQMTHDMPAVRRESAARTGQLGPQAEKTAAEFSEQQAPQIEAARETVERGMDPAGKQVVAASPYEAAELAGESFRKEAARSKAGVTEAYDTAKALPGEIEAQAVVGLGNRVRSNLGADIILDEQLTPFASKMVDSVDDTISKLRIPNKAELAEPDRTEIAGVTLRGIEQVRKKLSEYRRGAYSTGNATDGRAASAVMDAFDNSIDQAINSGAFRGDPRAIQAWNDARAAHADYKTTFGKGKGDPVGNVVQKILGDRNNPPATANTLADYLYGASGVNPSDLNIGVAMRMKKVLGADSPEWAAVRQGLFRRLTEKISGDEAVSHGSTNITNRLNKFLNSDGKDLAAVLYTPDQRKLMQQYADLHRALEIPKGGYNSSETSTFVAPMLQKAANYISAGIGGVIGHLVAPGLHGVGEAAGAVIASKGSAAVSNAVNAKKISSQMPIIERQLAEWRKEVLKQGSGRGSVPALTARTAALSQSLDRIGIDGSFLRQMHGTVPSAAEGNKNVGPPRGNNEPDQGAGGKSHGGVVHRAAGGAVNHNHNPSEAQKKAGNYAKTHKFFQGLDITIENLKGKPRTGIGRDGKKWSVTMPASYGYLKRTEGADGDHVDVYLGPNEKSDQVFVVDQKDAETGKFDEHKCMLGFNNEAEARRTYRAGFSDGKDRIKHMRRMSMAEFRQWLDKGDTSKQIKNYATGGAVKRALQSLKEYADGGAPEESAPFDLMSGVRVGADTERTEPEAGPNRYTRAAIQSIGGMPHSMMTLPGRAFDSARQMAETGEYDPGPVLEAAMLPMGTGALAGVPMRAGEAVVGAGPVRRTSLPMDEASRMARAEEQGFEGPWYHGTMRADRLTDAGKINPKRATSGPMPFFTDDPAIASNYAKGKPDTSMADIEHTRDYFTVSPKDLGISGRSPLTVEQSWHFLPGEVKQDILAKAKRVGYENPAEASGPLTLHPPGKDASISGSQYERYLREERGNPLAALRKLWVESGELVGSETELANIYRLAGYKAPISEVNAPWTTANGVMPARLRMTNPLKTDDAAMMTGKVLPELEAAFKRDRTRSKPDYMGADSWDKNTRYTPREWVEQAKRDYAKGDNSFVWTSIPDKVTAELRRLGYDGILDNGGKMGGHGHRVAVPFGPEQVRSRFARFDPSKVGSKDLLASGAGAALLAGVARREQD